MTRVLDHVSHHLFGVGLLLADFDEEAKAGYFALFFCSACPSAPVAPARHRHPRRGRMEWQAGALSTKGLCLCGEGGGLPLEGPHKITPHVLRHTAATWAIQQGADLWQAAGFLGMTVEMLQERYGHHHPDFQRDVARAITASPRRS